MMRAAAWTAIPRNVTVDCLDLTRVDANPDVDRLVLEAVADGDGALQRRTALLNIAKSIAGRVDFAPSQTAARAQAHAPLSALDNASTALIA